MTAPFAALEARLTAAVFTRLSNADALLDGADVQGIFDNGYRDNFAGIASTGPTFTLPTASAFAARPGSELRVDVDGSAARAGVSLWAAGAGTVFRVRTVEPDGSGVTVLRLELAQ